MKTRAEPRCSACQDSGWIVTNRDSVEGVVPCSKCRSEDRRRKLIVAAAIPPRYFDRGFQEYSTHHSLQERALQRAIDYVESFPEVPRGLLFAGPCGVGKTHLSVAILKSLILEKYASGRFIDEAELLRRLQFSYGPNSPETERELLAPLMNVDVLVWDDLGTGRPTEWVAETIRMVLNHRYTYNKQTILSTNWPLVSERKTAVATSEQSLAERIGQRLFSRIMEMCEIVEIQGPDARIEIHKPRLDFEANRRESRPLIPAGAVRCPQCRSENISFQDFSKPRQSGISRFVEIACSCPGCHELFTVRYFLKSGRIEYPA